VPTATVAIKVLHPDVEAYIDRDLRIMYFFARCVNLLPGMQWLSLPEEVQVFGSMMRRQLDLQNEADNLATFEANFAPRRISVNFPRPLKVWSSKDVLVEEHVNAVPLENFLRNGGGPFDEQIATVGLDAFLVCPAPPISPPLSDTFPVAHAPNGQLCPRRPPPR
jgi:aarF domain-containing kinase